MSDSTPLDVVGAVDAIHPSYNLAGWTALRNNMSERLTVEAIIGDKVVSSTINNIVRPDTGPNGFSLSLPFVITPERVLQNDISFRVRSEDGRTATLHRYQGFLEFCETEVLIQKLAQLSEARRQAILARFDAKLPGPLQLTDLIGNTGKLSNFSLPVGLVSRDGTAVVGMDGEMFILGGSNNLRSQYTLGPSEVAGTVEQWLAVIQDRAKRCAESGIRFVQTIIPEKTSVLRHSFPVHIPRSTTVMEMVDTAASERIADYLSLRGVLGQIGPRTYRRLDSHFTPYGAACVAVEMARKLGYDASSLMDDMAPGETADLVYTGDLGVKFTDLVEEVSFPKRRTSAVLVKSQTADRQTGSVYVWRNPEPIIGGKVVVFGNSFFGRGEGAEDISWWFSRIFAETHFVWSGLVDWRYVDEHRPQAMVCQTIERFMAGTPKT